MRDLSRIPLAEAIPLDMPLTAFLETTNLCNFKCRFCPTGHPEILKGVGRKSGAMTLDSAKRIIDQLALFPRKLKKLQFHFMGESLVNKHTPEMIAYAVSRNVSEWYELRTNGYLLNPQTNQKLIDAGLDCIGISIEAMDAEKYRVLTGKNVDMQRLVDNITDLYKRRGKCEIFVKIIDAGLSEEDKRQFFYVFSPIADKTGIEYITDLPGSSYDFKLGFKSNLTMHGHDFGQKIICPYPFYTMGITWAGDVLLCCYDWSYRTAVGNVNKDSLINIWNGTAAQAFRMMHAEGRRNEHSICRNCVGPNDCPDNIDGDAGKILANLHDFNTMWDFTT